MPNHNNVTLIGRITAAPELKTLPSGAKVLNFTLAINRTYKPEEGEKREETTFIPVTAWNRTAEVIVEYSGKGAPLFVDGRLAVDSWEDSETKKPVSKMFVVAETVQLLGTPAAIRG